MTNHLPLCRHPAFGAPGIEPRWTRGAKEAVGTAYSAPSRVWFTMAQGVVTEVYYPTIDQPQIRDLQYLVSDGRALFHDERRETETTIAPISEDALGYRVINTDRSGAYRINKEIITDPHQSCLLIATEFVPLRSAGSVLRLFALLAPHLEVGGWHNDLRVADIAGRRMLVGHKGRTWLVLGATVPFLRCSCGYVGASDGWTDLAEDFRLDWQFDCALDGNVAGIAELDLDKRRDFTLGLAFGHSLHSAANTLLQALDAPFAESRERFVEQWRRAGVHRLDLGAESGDGGALSRRSVQLIQAHEDKTFPGAIIASMSIPWGEVKSDDDLGGYHLVWTRDMVKSATGLLAAGYTETARRALIYLATSQRDDGGFFQNFWIDGQPYWRGEQLDEAAFPIVLASRLKQMGALGGFDPYPMVLRAAGFLIAFGPVTPQERWEECSGYSPSTLAALIAALTGAANMARERGDSAAAGLIQSYADFLNAHLEGWTVTRAGSLVAGLPRHYIRILPVRPGAAEPDGSYEDAVLQLANRGPGEPSRFLAREIVDGGFLELVRYGIRRADDPVIADSVRVLDAVLRFETPFGPVWRRYNHDGYGQRNDGGPYQGWGQGRSWPLLSGERGHYELAAGRSPDPYIRALEQFAAGCELLPEQVWDRPDLPEKFMYFGRPTGSAMPLMWAHSEYLKLLRSRRDGVVFDRLPGVAERYAAGLAPKQPEEFWSFNYPNPRVPAGGTVCIPAREPFLLHWSADEWHTVHDTQAAATPLGLYVARVNVPAGTSGHLRFTFHWTAPDRWEGRDFAMAVVSARGGRG